MKHLLLVVWVLVLTSCAMYSYEHKSAAGDECRVSILSRREVQGPVSMGVDKDCAVNVGTGSLTGGQLSPQEMGALNTLLLKLVAPNVQQLLAPVTAPAPVAEPAQ